MLAILLGPKFDPDFGNCREGDMRDMPTNKPRSRSGNAPDVARDDSMGADETAEQVVQLEPLYREMGPL